MGAHDVMFHQGLAAILARGDRGGNRALGGLRPDQEFAAGDLAVNLARKALRLPLRIREAESVTSGDSLSAEALAVTAFLPSELRSGRGGRSASWA